MIKTEYLRFLKELLNKKVPNDVLKIASLVQENLELLIPLTTAQGQRIKKVVELAQANWNTLCSSTQLKSEQAEKQTYSITQIKKLTVGPYRGFAQQEVFDIDSKLVLVYGPNGTGKSSFCEALEYALLGNVSEAENKRFRNQEDYLKNAHVNRFSFPSLIGTSIQGVDTPITANEALYRFCFIEKNRIDSFSRLSAQTPAKQTELISTLFGLDAFSEFVRNFTDSMDDRYIDLVGIKAEELKSKRQALAGFQQNLESFSKELKRLDEEETELSKEFRGDCTFSQMILEFNGSDENNGLIKQLEAELENPIEPKSNLTLSGLQSLNKSIKDDVQKLRIKQQELANTRDEVSYKKLYEAIVQMKDTNIGHCPACQTPLSQVTVNPFEHASTELNKLQHLAILQDFIGSLNENVNKSLTKLSDMINTCCKKFPENDVLSLLKETASDTPTINWWISFQHQLRDGLTPWEHIEVHIKKLEDTDIVISQSIENRARILGELGRLRKLAAKLVKLQTRRDTTTDTIRRCEEEIAKFNIDNALLISYVDSEKEIVARNQSIANAYDVFVQQLNDYSDRLPAQLVANLGEMIVLLYNAFNRHDAEFEQLAAVKLPLHQNQRLEISFKKDPDKFFDALHILSEGHIRCIGLAILSAKNIKEGCPILIFDDPVNAIDDDHRESIRRTMFKDTYFENKQVILACHGEEFFKDIQNLLPAKDAKKIKAVTFLPKSEASQIYVDKKCPPRNYVIAARTHFENSEIRDSLDKSRKALESLAMDKLWAYVRKFSDGKLVIKLRSPKDHIELRGLSEQIKCKIAQTGFSDPSKSAILDPLASLVGISGESREWRYLNKGTHEEADRTEFDRQTVSEILIALEQLDAALY